MSRFFPRTAANFALLAALTTATGLATARAGENDRLFDFSDAFYRKNGVNPAAIINRANGTPPRSVIDYFPFASQRNVRMLATNPGYDQSGGLRYWSVMGDILPTGFTNDAAGRNAKAIADSMVLYVFPRRDQPNPITLGANRQADIVDMRHGYFSNDPLGLWLHVWVSYTDKAFNTPDGRKALQDLSRRNGLALDGTPIVRTLSDLEGLVSKGYMAKRFRNQNGSEGPMYGICPVINDPRDGGIAPDAFLSFVKHPDGSPLEPAFLINFLSLQHTGDWAD